MVENWTCPKCNAFNPPRRNVCWQCKHNRRVKPRVSAKVAKKGTKATTLFLGFGLIGSAILACGTLIFFLLTISDAGRSTANNASASQMIIASQGGSVELANDTRVDIPKDALASNARVSVSIPTQLDDKILFPKNTAVTIREINASGVSLKSPIPLTFSYASLQRQESLSPDAVFVARWDGTAWQYLEGDIDSQRKTVTAKTDHLSIFGVFDLQSFVDGVFKGRPLPCRANQKTDQAYKDLVREINKANISETLIEREINVYQIDRFNNFAASSEECIYADRAWLDDKSKWLPVSKRYLLEEPILAHELSHIVRGYTKYTEYDITRTILKEILRRRKAKDFMREFGTALLALSDAERRYDANAMLSHYSTLVSNISRLMSDYMDMRRDICAQLQEMELKADKDGVTWAGHHKGETNEVGLVFSYFLQERKYTCEPPINFHPTGVVRAQRIRDVFGLGSYGGIFGTVYESGGYQVSQALGVTFKIDNQKIEQEVDENGQFLVTGLSLGQHTNHWC